MRSLATERALSPGEAVDAALEPSTVSRADIRDTMRGFAERPKLTGEALRDECNAVRLAAVQRLTEQGTDENEAQAAVDAEIMQSGGLLAQRASLGSLMRNGVPAPVFLESPTLGERLFYRDDSFIISGHPKSGKSWAMLATALDCVRAGRPVVYIDLENGERLLAKRLLLLGADVFDVDSLLHYIPFPKLALADLGGELETIAERLPGAFVIVDSLRGAIARLSPAGDPLKVNDQQSIERVCGPIMQVCKSQKITVGIIDHATKPGNDQDGYSTSGSQAKEAAVGAVYFWTKIEPYSKEIAGVVKIKATRDRDGELDFERYYKAGGQGDGPFMFARTDRAEVKSGKLIDDVRQLLADNPGEPFTKTKVREKVKGNNQDIDAAVAWLADNDPDFHVQAGDKHGTVRYVWDSAREASGLAI